MTTQIGLTELMTQHDQLLAEAVGLILHRAEILLNKVPESCTTFVMECCSGHSPSAFAEWLGYLVTNTNGGYGCDAHMRATNTWEMYGFKSSDEALAALKELVEAWKGQINLNIIIDNITIDNVVYREGQGQLDGVSEDGPAEVYAIKVLCRAANA